MKQRIKETALLLLVLCLFAGCGKVRTENGSSGTDAASSSVQPGADNPSSSGNSQENAASSAETAQLYEASLEQAASPRPTPVPHKASVSLKKPYKDSEREVTVLGLKEYKKFKGEFGTDKAGKGNCFLVLFLKIKNTMEKKDYIHPMRATAKVDGKKQEHIILFNLPENYPSIFDNIQPGQERKGTIVWEVPADWKKFKFSYAGWDWIDGLALNATFTPKDLKDPEKY